MTTERNRETPLWREFEQLVLRIEQALTPKGAVVKSPDRIRSLITGRLREVDASISMCIGSTKIVIIIECRHRKSKQDVTWIEQLNTKKQALGVARLIAVSISPFTSGAIKAASLYSIDLRVVSEITEQEIESWSFPKSVTHLYKHCDLLGSPSIKYEPLNIVEMETQLSRKPDSVSSGKPEINEKVFFSPSTNKKLSFNDIWLIVDSQQELFKNVPRNGDVIRTKVNLTVEDDLSIKTEVGFCFVKKISFDVALSWRHEVIKLSEAKQVKYIDQHDKMPHKLVV